MDDWLIWLIAAVVLAIGEVASPSFFLAPFALGAVAGAAAALAGLGDVVPWLLFAVVTSMSFLFLRPIARRHLFQPAKVRTGAAALIGRSAFVEERIANREGTGIVKLDGEQWTARAFDEDRTFEAGERVEVVEIRGATALVTD